MCMLVRLTGLGNVKRGLMYDIMVTLVYVRRSVVYIFDMRVYVCKGKSGYGKYNFGYVISNSEYMNFGKLLSWMRCWTELFILFYFCTYGISIYFVKEFIVCVINTPS